MLMKLTPSNSGLLHTYLGLLKKCCQNFKQVRMPKTFKNCSAGTTTLPKKTLKTNIYLIHKIEINMDNYVTWAKL